MFFRNWGIVLNAIIQIVAMKTVVPTLDMYIFDYRKYWLEFLGWKTRNWILKKVLQFYEILLLGAWSRNRKCYSVPTLNSTLIILISASKVAKYSNL